MTDQELIALLRGRLATVEAAAENLLDVFNHTGEARKVAVDRLVAALTTDFKTAVACSPDMTDAHRAEWLEAEAAPVPDAEPGYDPLAPVDEGAG